MLAPNEIAPFFILLAVAGNDTTRTAISHGMNLLSQNPDQRKIWQDDIAGVTGPAVEEIVRVASPVTFMRRTVTHDLTLSGQDFSEGDRMILFYGAANRDPRVFDDPETFDVRRDPNPHVGFGGPGPHFCLGAHLARREVAVMFRQLLTRFPDIEIAGDPVPLQALGIPLVGGIKRLPVTLHAHREGRRVPDVATPTALDEQFVHQIPELLTERRHATTRTGGRATSSTSTTRPARATSCSSRWRTTRRASAWTRCRWAGSAATQLIGLHGPARRRRSAHHRAAGRAHRGGRAVGGGPPLGRPRRVRDRPRPHVHGPGR